MAAIEVRKSCSKRSYRARVRVKGYPQITASFAYKADAKRWAAGTEADIHSGRYFPETHHTFSDAIKWYSDKHLPQLKDAAKRSKHLAWWNDQLGHMRLSDIRSDTISKCRSILQTQPSAFGRHQGRPRSDATVNRYMASLSAMFTFAVNERGWVEKNPCSKLKKLREGSGRTRFLTQNELSALLSSYKKEASYPELVVIVLIAVTSGFIYNQPHSPSGSWQAAMCPSLPFSDSDNRSFSQSEFQYNITVIALSESIGYLTGARTKDLCD